MVTVTRNNDKELKEEVMSTTVVAEETKLETTYVETPPVLTPVEVEEIIADLETSFGTTVEEEREAITERPGFWRRLGNMMSAASEKYARYRLENPNASWG